MKQYQDVTMTGQVDQYLFGIGQHFEVYERFGAHLTEKDGMEGVCFSVWAPAAKSVSVVGTFNGWREAAGCMERLGASGIYELFVPGAIEGDLYKYCIHTRTGEVLYKADPYAFESEVRPGNASRVAGIEDYRWRDQEWMTRREKKDYRTEPINILEVHPGSFQKRPITEADPDGFLNYKQLAHALGDYAEEMGYTHVELLGILEYPFDGSWGYQVTGYFAPTSRYGNPKDFMYLVDYLHRKGIGVYLDWVPAHFPKDAHGLACFDGTPLYEYEDPRKGEHREWGTKVFDYGKKEVRNFLCASAVFWLKEYHLDGLRVDAVSSMLYLDYGRGPGEWIPNIYGGNQNLEAVEFLQLLNRTTRKFAPGSVMIAEESTSWPGVTGEPEGQGLGFHMKWNMGWMNDTLAYMEKDPIYRSYHHDHLTFGMVYAYTEHFIQALSHDEVVHGKHSLLGKMPAGEGLDPFGDLRAYYGFYIGHPGKKLLFMGQEFAQEREWSENRELDWFLLSEPKHLGMQRYMHSLYEIYREYPALYELDYEPGGFQWMDPDDAEESIVSFARFGRNGKNLLFVINFTPVERKEYRLGTPGGGSYELLLDSSWKKFGGTREELHKIYEAENIPSGQRETSFSYDLSGYGAAIFSF
ncbi:1,4-alpha-glucan branching protein GlgB [Fusicatenibacter faecihominis]|uniref:1,4-alpha-glucan branching enzyme GlgB n=2 Tax=Clostridia TaxID=186801 RepID=A0AAE3J6K5_9FIRM|nr:1,4-alpha-glucan branching protein GlgB [Fusicatenibacter faecihominis]MCC2190108.1 1,4-alpha-glucan branching protein GlgB [Fusicatenibacter faecihominis]